jgi:hypothetical protein
MCHVWSEEGFLSHFEGLAEAIGAKSKQEVGQGPMLQNFLQP